MLCVLDIRRSQSLGSTWASGGAAPASSPSTEAELLQSVLSPKSSDVGTARGFTPRATHAPAQWTRAVGQPLKMTRFWGGCGGAVLKIAEFSAKNLSGPKMHYAAAGKYRGPGPTGVGFVGPVPWADSSFRDPYALAHPPARPTLVGVSGGRPACLPVSPRSPRRQ